MRSMMLGGMGVVVALLASQPVAADEKAREAEVAWAKGVAAEFFTEALTLAGKDFTSRPLGLLSAELQTEVNNKDSPLFKLLWQYTGARFQIKSSEVSPNGAEIVLTAELRPLSEDERKKWMEPLDDEEKSELKRLLTLMADKFGSFREVPANVHVWMAKDSAGRWVIRHISARLSQK